MAAAISAARTGVEVRLVEARPESGGTVVHSLIHTIAGLYDADGELLNPGLPTELVERLKHADDRVAVRRMGRVHVLNTPPDVYRRVTRAWMEEESNLTLVTGTRVGEVTTNGSHVASLVLDDIGNSESMPVTAVVDATGTAELVRLIDDRLVDDRNAAAGGLVVRLRGIEPGSLAFPKGIGIVRTLRAAASDGRLPATCEHAWIDTGLDPDEAYLKLFVPINWDGPSSETAARSAVPAIVDLLNAEEGFAGCEIAEVGTLGIRDGGRTRGEYVLTADDLRAGRTFDDAVCRGAWPIEYWHPSDGVQWEPVATTYEIPERSLRLAGWRNVWMAGKCLSADPLAQSAARVVGTCWAMGEAVGRLAAEHESAGVLHEPR